MSSDNPLLQLSLPLPFDRVRPEHVGEAADALLKDARERMEKIGGATWDETFGALDAMTEQLDDAMGLAGHLEAVETTPALRDAYNAVQPRVSAFYSSISLDARLYRALKSYAETPEARALTGMRKRYLDKTLADFRRHGAELDDAGKKRLSEIDVELTELTLKFSQNTLDATNEYELLVDDRGRLAGLPESAIDAAQQSAEQAGKTGYRFTLAAPSYVPAMTYLDDSSLREALYRAFNTRSTKGARDNRPLVRRILGLRREKATLLGFKSFADLVLQDRMAKSGDNARKFVATLREKTLPHFHRENEDLRKFAGVPELSPWDVSYYAEKQRRALYDFDEEALRPYFALDRVIDGLFEVAKRLYGLRVERDERATVWHPDVRAYQIRDEDERAIGTFYVDVYPRESKRDGAWMHGLITACKRRDTAVEALIANVTPPVGDRPALLNHREVETMFHEFGHLLHHALGCVELRSLAGTNVAWDFVELPSQIMENWCWEREALDLFARHYETDATIPDELLGKMRRARTFRAANMMMRQLGFAEVDLALHVDIDLEKDDPMEVARKVLEAHSTTKLPSDYAMIASFGHLFGAPVGYAAGYYSYKWAEVLDADAFATFREKGIFSREVGDRFRKEILARGDSEDPEVLYQRFAGREPRLEPLLERSGLIRSACFPPE
jgi:oligopeptidase A